MNAEITQDTAMEPDEIGDVALMLLAIPAPPWRWFGHVPRPERGTDRGRIFLATDHSGQRVVMSFTKERNGVQPMVPMGAGRSTLGYGLDLVEATEHDGRITGTKNGVLRFFQEAPMIVSRLLATLKSYRYHLTQLQNKLDRFETGEAAVPWGLVAESAYMAYAASTGNKNYKGDPMPAFADLPAPIQVAWEASARQACACLRPARKEAFPDPTLWAGWLPPGPEEVAGALAKGGIEGARVANAHLLSQAARGQLVVDEVREYGPPDTEGVHPLPGSQASIEAGWFSPTGEIEP